MTVNQQNNDPLFALQYVPLPAAYKSVTEIPVHFSTLVHMLSAKNYTDENDAKFVSEVLQSLYNTPAYC